MARRPSALPPALPWPVFSRAEAVRAGVPADRLRRPDLAQLRRGLYARRDIPLEEIDLAAALCRHDPQLVIVGLSAARLLDIPLPERLERWGEGTPVEVATSGGRGRSDQVVRWHDLSLLDGDIQRTGYRHGPSGRTSPLPMTTRARTWRDLAGHLGSTALVSAGDHLLRVPRPELEGRTDPWCTREELLAVATGRHAGSLRAAIAQMRVGADSPKETEMRLAFIAAGLPEPEINVPLRGPDGITRHAPDFQWRDFSVCAEYDGIGHSDPEQIQRDIRRARRARAAGFLELRLFAADLRQDCAPAIRVVRDELVARGWRSAP